MRFPQNQRVAAKEYQFLYQNETIMSKRAMLMGALASCSSMEFAQYAFEYKQFKSLPCHVCPNGVDKKPCKLVPLEACQEIYAGLGHIKWNGDKMR